uniref:hypothetical protein n=1 Tax=Pseudomonas sp. TH15 TaxID=2796381 RepID=UPI001F5B27A1|nr:hypothetical protein [Pseudomonas sp. TH15]
MDDAKVHSGEVMLKTVQGESVTVMLHDAKLWLEDANGGRLQSLSLTSCSPTA